jgi:hypothetical protein
VANIQQSTDLNEWYNVRYFDNPADLISRGDELDQLTTSALWWDIPEWQSPSLCDSLKDEDISE